MRGACRDRPGSRGTQVISSTATPGNACLACPSPLPPVHAALAPQPLYGFGSRDPARFVRASGHPDLFFLADPERPFSQARATAACQRRTWNCSRMGGS
jgi:hypothetical protein